MPQPSIPATASAAYSGAALTLLETAEQLFAAHGIDAVSTREIARAAGHKNHSAVAYHFGKKEDLVAAILELRLPPINQRRAHLLTYLKDAGQSHNLRAIVSALVIPLVEELRSDTAHNHYLGFIGQLSAPRRDALNRGANPQHTTAIGELSQLLASALADLATEVFKARAELMHAQLYQTLAFWDTRRRAGDPAYADRELGWRTENLIDFISAGLSGPVSAPTRRQLQGRPA